MPAPERMRVLFIGEAATLSHVARPAALAASLGALGALGEERYEPILACDDRYATLLGDVGCEVVPLRSRVADLLFERLYRGEPLFDVATLDAYVEEDLRLLRRFQPDVVVGDLRQSLAVSSRLLGVPYVNLINAHWSPACPLPFELAEHPMVPLLGAPLAELCFRLFSPVGFAYHALPLNVVRVKYGLSPLGIDMKELYCQGDRVLYPDLPELIPTRTLPPHHQFLGPVLWSPRVPLPAWWDELPADRPIVYVNLGSSGQRRLLDTVLAALARLPVTVVAGAAAERETAFRPPNAWLAGYLPGDEVARRASLVISNGGTTAGYQALTEGVPLLGLPSNMDQLIFSRAVHAAGAGEILRERDAAAESVHEQARRILADGAYREAAGRLAASPLARAAGTRFAAVLDEMMEGSLR
jgi:UDP:flavonoid glycosyltransferase YjiC (YdhE family)